MRIPIAATLLFIASGVAGAAQPAERTKTEPAQMNQHFQQARDDFLNKS